MLVWKANSLAVGGRKLYSDVVPMECLVGCALMRRFSTLAQEELVLVLVGSDVDPVAVTHMRRGFP